VKTDYSHAFHQAAKLRRQRLKSRIDAFGDETQLSSLQLGLSAIFLAKYIVIGLELGAHCDMLLAEYLWCSSPKLRRCL